MKKAIITGVLSVCLIIGVLLSGCTAVFISEEVGPTITMNYVFFDFSRIEIGHAFDLEITRADTHTVKIIASESLLERVKITQTGDKLEIGLENLFFHSHRSPRVVITLPELKGLYLSGASEGSVSGFKSSDNFELTLSGASELEMDIEAASFVCEMSGSSEISGYLKATSCDIDISEASSIDLSGSGGDIRLEASGASDMNLANFTVNDAEIDFSGASDASLEINGRLDVELSGASTLEYSGNPTLGEIDLSGGSELERR